MPRGVRRELVWVAVVVVSWLVLQAIRSSAHPRVKVVYLVPSDVRPRAEFAEGAHRAMAVAQRWYFEELKNGVTFALADPLVETVRTGHPESWYRSSAGRQNDRKAVWTATIDEAFDLTGGTYNDRRYVWVYFLDADLPEIPAQGTSGVALLSRDDILDLDGQEALCGTVGTITHELGHAFGLEHPPDCDSHRKSDQEAECASMSYMGSWNFPRAQYLPAERSFLLHNSALVATRPEAQAVKCSE